MRRRHGANQRSFDDPRSSGVFGGRRVRFRQLPLRLGQFSAVAGLVVLAWAGCFSEPPDVDAGVGCVDLTIEDGTLVTIPAQPIAQHFEFEWEERRHINGGSAPESLPGSQVAQVITVWPGDVGVGQPVGELERMVSLPTGGGTTRSVNTAELVAEEDGPLVPGEYTVHIRTDLPNSECSGCQCDGFGWGEEEMSFEVLPCPDLCGDLQAVNLAVQGDVTEDGDFEFVWQNVYLGDICSGENQPSTGNFTETITFVLEDSGQSSETVRAANPLTLGEEGEERSIDVSELAGQHPAGAYSLTLLLDADMGVLECPEDSDNNQVTLEFAVQP